MKGLRFLLWLVAGLALLLNNGCAYMSDRGHDALDMIDIGVIVNNDSKPQLGLYIDNFSITPLGYADIKGTAYGTGSSQIGKLDFATKHWGALLWGSERETLGEFNPHDPRVARPDQADLTEPARYDAGIVSIVKGNDPPPKLQYVECNKLIYLGWIGLYAHCRPLDMLDFILGWTTIDIMGDDNRSVPKAK